MRVTRKIQSKDGKTFFIYKGVKYLVEMTEEDRKKWDSVALYVNPKSDTYIRGEVGGFHAE